MDKLDIEYKLTERWKKIDSRYKTVFYSTFLWGFFAHGFTFFNKYAFHDDISLTFSVGNTYILGRWMLGILDTLGKFLFQHHYSMPLFNGVISLLFIALALCLMVKLFDIRHKGYIISLAGILAAVPSMTSLFGYMFTAPYYMFAFFLAAAGAYLVLCPFHPVRYACGIFLSACSMGIYQAYLPVFCSMLLIRCICDVKEEKMKDLRSFGKEILYMGVAALGSVVIYLLCTKISLALTHTVLEGQRGIDSMGQEGIVVYLRRFLTAYRQLLLPEEGRSAFMYPQGTIWLYRIIMITGILLVIILITQSFRKNRAEGIQMFFFSALIPIAVNLIYVMCAYEEVYSLTIYGQMMIFVFLVVLSEKISLSHTIKNRFYVVSCISMLLMSVLFCRYDNATYLKAEMVKSSVISYYNTMITKIKNTEGYKSEYPVAYINEMNISDKSLTWAWEFTPLIMSPYWGYQRVVNDYAYRSFMRYWCGFAPQTVDPEPFAEMEEVKKMPSYPDDGSICIINETVVIKLGEDPQ